MFTFSIPFWKRPRLRSKLGTHDSMELAGMQSLAYW
jgi:hypothetical protein